MEGARNSSLLGLAEGRGDSEGSGCCHGSLLGLEEGIGLADGSINTLLLRAEVRSLWALETATRPTQSSRDLMLSNI